MSKILTAERARELLDYNPETGVLRNRTNRSSNARAGAQAGYIHSDGYRGIKLEKRDYLAHRLAFLLMKGRWPRDQMDHINGVRDDNRWANLREVGHQGNQRNQRRPCNNTSGHMGVCWDGLRGKWRAYINQRGSSIKHLYWGDSQSEAIAARKTAERKYGYHANHGRVIQ